MKKTDKVFIANIGNTNTSYGIFPLSGNAPEVLHECPTEKFTTGMLPENIPLAYASVVPEKNSIFKNRDSFRLHAGVKTGLDFSKVDAPTLGADRVANAIALSITESLPAVCIDCGTALTFEIVDENKVFLGGAIAPGRNMARKALHDYTAQLPFIPAGDTSEPLLGCDTISSINIGTDAAVIGAVKEMLERIKKVLNGKNITVIALGGDAEFLFKNIQGIEIRDKCYTLKGILKAWELNKIEN